MWLSSLGDYWKPLVLGQLVCETWGYREAWAGLVSGGIARKAQERTRHVYDYRAVMECHESIQT